ncbi:MAG: hypothetical protein PHQ22_09135 [Sulfuricurvum sp.]|nr:hypothetical protein [Sulfuricurvum sp.]
MQYNEHESGLIGLNGESPEYNLYKEACKYNTLDWYKTYISKYPDGMWNEEATQKIEELEKELEEKKKQEEEAKRLRELEEQRLKEEEEKRKIEQENKRDQDAYSEAQKIGSIQSFRAYLNQFPNGLYREKVAIKIINIIESEKVENQQKQDEFFNNVLGRWLLEQFKKEYQFDLCNEVALQRLYQNAYNIEEKLMMHDKYTIDLPFLERLNEHPIHWKIDITNEVLKKIYLLDSNSQHDEALNELKKKREQDKYFFNTLGTISLILASLFAFWGFTTSKDIILMIIMTLGLMPTIAGFLLISAYNNKTINDFLHAIGRLSWGLAQLLTPLIYLVYVYFSEYATEPVNYFFAVVIGSIVGTIIGVLLDKIWQPLEKMGLYE